MTRLRLGSMHVRVHGEHHLAVSAAAFGVAILVHSAAPTLAANNNSQKSPKSATTASGSKMTTSYGTHLEPILKAVQATPEQRKEITDVFEDFRPKIQPLKVKYKEVQAEFLTVMTSSRPPEEIMLKQEELNELFNRIMNQYTAMNLKIRKYLSASQCEQYEDYRAKQGWKK